MNKETLKSIGVCIIVLIAIIAIFKMIPHVLRYTAKRLPSWKRSVSSTYTDIKRDGTLVVEAWKK